MIFIKIYFNLLHEHHTVKCAKRSYPGFRIVELIIFADTATYIVAESGLSSYEGRQMQASSSEEYNELRKKELQPFFQGRWWLHVLMPCGKHLSCCKQPTGRTDVEGEAVAKLGSR